MTTITAREAAKEALEEVKKKMDEINVLLIRGEEINRLCLQEKYHLQLRSSWHPAEVKERDEEYRIILSTTPRVEIRGWLGTLDNATPITARLFFREDTFSFAKEFETTEQEKAVMVSFAKNFDFKG